LPDEGGKKSPVFLQLLSKKNFNPNHASPAFESCGQQLENGHP
jgi:hypothetical protein